MDVCEACGHPVHRTNRCPARLFGEPCACDEPLTPATPEKPPVDVRAAILERIRHVWANVEVGAPRFAATGMDSDHLRRIILGYERPSSTDLAQIAEATGVTVEWLLTGTDPITITFCAVNEGESPDLEGYGPSGCLCPPGDNRYTLGIEEGGPSLVHAACGLPPGDSWGDWADLVYMEPVPVTAEWVPDCDGEMWHGMERCEDGATVRVTPDDGYDAARETNSRLNREKQRVEADAEARRLALSRALGLGTGAPWDAILERAKALGE
jgi:hypothetical protein